MLNLSQKTINFQNGGQIVNFETKAHRKLIQELHKRFAKNQTRIKSDDYRPSY